MTGRSAADQRSATLRERLSRQLRGVLRAKPDIAVEPIFRRGRAPDVVIAEAERVGAEVIVLGTRGSPVGSVAEAVMRSAGRPVLVVPAVTPPGPIVLRSKHPEAVRAVA